MRNSRGYGGGLFWIIWSFWCKLRSGDNRLTSNVSSRLWIILKIVLIASM